MILPIYTYGQPVLRKVAQPIDPETYEGLQTLIDNMFETMDRADGVGLAAPQIGLPIRLVVIDATPMGEEFEECKDRRFAMINPQLLEVSEETISYEEGCLSVPNLHEKVQRPVTIKISYLDRELNPHTEEVGGFLARIMQHEYDHLEGHVFTDRISPLRRTMIKNKLEAMAKGKVRCSYRIK